MPGSEAEGSENVGGVSNQLATLVPSFDPAEDSVEIWSSKVELLLNAWPPGKIRELVTRLILGCKGTAFQKLQLHQSELLENDPKCVRRVVELVGGTWGQVPLEKKFEAAEKALYRGTQKSDETADSYLSRSDVIWTELINKGMKLEELRAYVVLRGSRLTSEDKKRIIVESGAEANGVLDMKRVTSAIRMLGSGFFQELTGGKKDKSLKTYDHNAFFQDTVEGDVFQETFWTSDDPLDEATVEAMACEDDEDAAMIIQYEDAITEAIQGDNELSALFSTYQDARKRLAEKVRFRGFWSVSGKQSGKGKKGYKGKGKGRSRDLASRIANSLCKICDQPGHWKNECPKRRAGSSTTTTPSVPASYVTVDEMPDAMANLAIAEDPDVCDTLAIVNVSHHVGIKHDTIWNKKDAIHVLKQLRHRRKQPSSDPSDCRSREPDVPKQDVTQVTADHISLFASTGTIGVVDLGASQTVIGSRQVPELLSQLPPEILKSTKKQECKLTFRFGNQQTLVSQFAIVLPLQQHSFRIAVVPGNTPFLISSSFLRGIGAVIDTEDETLWSKKLKRYLKIERSHKNLFLMDLNELWTTRDQVQQRDVDIPSVWSKQNAVARAAPSEATMYVDRPEGTITDKVVESVKHVNMDNADANPLPPTSADISQDTVANTVHSETPDHGHHLRAPEPVSQRQEGVSRWSGDREDSPDVTGRVGEGSDHIRQGQIGPTVSNGVQRPLLDGLVCCNLREVNQGSPPTLHHLCREEVGGRDQGDGLHQERSQEPSHQDQSGGSLQCLVMDSGEGRDLRGGGRVRSLPSMPTSNGSSNGTSGRPNGQPTDGESSDEPSHGADGRCPQGADCPREEPERHSVMQPEVVNQAVDFDFQAPSEKSLNTFQMKLKRMVSQFEKEFQNIQLKTPSRKRLDLLEVMCHDHSELTTQSSNLGGHAERFGLSQGDLSQKSGRLALFTKVKLLKPKDLWYSPVCAPWCMWNQFNEQRSLQLQEQIFQERNDNIWQVALGIVLLRIQTFHQGHFHWEQPQGSLMLRIPGTQVVTENLRKCLFDMCQVGKLTDPETGKFIRKRLNVWTTSEDLYQSLHGKLCSGQHVHRQIAGNTHFGNQTIKLSKFTEQYPRRFAKQVVKVLMYQNQNHLVLAGHADEPAPKRMRLTEKMSPAAIEAKLTGPNWQTVMKLADQQAPRVGTLTVDHGPLIQHIQQICPQHIIKHVVLCRGTDRYVGPCLNIAKGVAPLRRRICIRRRHEDVHVDEDWEPWEKLTNKNLRRKGEPARVSLNIFAAANVRPETTSAEASIRKHPNPAEDAPPSKMSRLAETTDEQLQASSQSSQEPLNSFPSEQSTNPNSVTDNSVHHEVIDLASQKHGPKFLQLSTDEQSWALKLHRNLGHPGTQKLVEFCRQLRCPDRILQAIPELKCSTCVEVSQPKVSRTSAIHEQGDFGDVISMDQITWTNQQGQQFHFYHIIDQSTLYHTAMIAPSPSSEGAKQALLQGWIQWAGPPRMLVVDAATELNSEDFQRFLQKYSICCKTCATEAHWQNARAERHGGILQMMLNKMDNEHPLNTYEELAIALSHATATKNQWSRHRGFPPEMLVFGKGVRTPGSTISDETHAAHSLAVNPQTEGQRFFQELQMRERARKAFASVDNDQTLRNAITARSRPHRGHYGQGDWVMLWKKRGEAAGIWEGPMQVISQEGQNVVWISRGTKLYRAAPEHVRPLSAVEEWKQNQKDPIETPNRITMGVTQYQNLQTQQQQQQQPQNTPHTDMSLSIPEPSATQDTITQNTEAPRLGDPPSEEEPEAIPDSNSSNTADNPPVESSAELPPEPWNVPIPDSDAELIAEHCFFDDVNEMCFHLDDDAAWKFEVDVTDMDIQNWKAETNPHEMAFIVSAAKKQRSEVKMTQLSPQEKEMFHAAKMKEIDSWLATETVCKILRHQIPMENILRCRWILTWKPVDSAEGNQTKHTPKARLVVLGYEDPLVHEIPRDSPTMSKLSRMLILQMAASHGWDIESFDIKTAFLRGQEHSDRVLGIEPNAELRERMKLKDNEVLKLLKGAYGRVDAPYLWFMELRTGLLNLGFIPAPFDPCTFVLPGDNGRTEGLVGIHVDDGLCCGSTLFTKKLQQLAQKFPFGSHKKRNFTFTGLKIDQQPDQSIHVQQTQYIKDIHPITINRERRNQPEDVVTEDERQALRAVIGSLQYAAVNSRPDICSRLGWLQSQINKSKVSTLIEANKVLHEAKVFADVTIRIQPIPVADLRFAAFSDASFASEKCLDSHQ